MNPQFEEVGRAFVQHYYTTFDTQRANLAALYQPSSMLSFEGERFMGPQPIYEKLVSKIGPDTRVQHLVKSLDCQPTTENGVLVLVSGELSIDGGPGLKYGQVFLLKGLPQGGFFVQNDIFRFNLD
eukprot:m51a1_g3398 putative nuclear transport (126) ;mRNA; r:539836-540369